MTQNRNYSSTKNKQLLLPTNTCFDDAIDIMLEQLRVNCVSPFRLRLVHAICTNGAKHYSHAWLEMDNAVAMFNARRADTGQIQRVITNLQKYRKSLGIIRTYSYTVSEAQEMNRKYCTYGPWERELLELCRDYSIIMK